MTWSPHDSKGRSAFSLGRHYDSVCYGGSAVRVENGEAVDKELWVLLEELQERNQALAAENTALRARPPTGSWACVAVPVPALH